MEELFKIIVTTVLIVAATAFSQLGKKKRAKQDMYIPEEENDTKNMSSDTLHNVLHTPNQSHRDKSLSTTACEPTLVSQNGSQIANKAQNIDSNNPVQEEFDLRKAVIYSEILSPKFKEEEF